MRKPRVVVQKQRSGRWSVKVEQVNGRWRSIGKTFATEPEARHARDCIDKTVQRRAKVRPETMAHFAQARIKARLKDGLASAQDDEGRWRNHCSGERWAAYPPNRVSRRDMRRFRDKLLSSGMHPKTAREVLLFVSGLFKDLVEDQVVSESPMAGLRLPSTAKRRAVGYLYPAEDSALLACEDVPLCYRMLYGFLAREGMRKSEALALTWDCVDLDNGAVRLDENKTDDPRAWALGEDVCAALRWWRDTAPDDCPAVFRGQRTSDLRTLRGSMLRRDLAAAGVTRPELFEESASRIAIRVHDLRATFVTLALASGRSETWVTDRTGHKSHHMVSRYRRQARTVRELDLGWLAPMHVAIPEMIRDVIRAADGADACAAESAYDLGSVAPPGFEPGRLAAAGFKPLAGSSNSASETGLGAVSWSRGSRADHESRLLVALAAKRWPDARRFARHYAVSCIGEGNDDLVARILDGPPHDLRAAADLLVKLGPVKRRRETA